MRSLLLPWHGGTCSRSSTRAEVSPGVPSCEHGVSCRHGVSKLQSVLLQHRLGLDAVAAPVSVAGEAGEGQQRYPGMQNKLRGWIRSQQCPVLGQERFLWPGVFSKLHVQRVSRPNISQLGLPHTALLSARN